MRIVKLFSGALLGFAMAAQAAPTWGEGRLVEAMSKYGAAARVPELWLYSANDRFFGPSLARRMYEVFVGAGGAAEFIEAPPSGLDGHGYFARAMDDWSPRVRAFLRRIGAAR